MNPMGTIDSIYKEEYYTLICTKYESYGPRKKHCSIMMLQIKFDRIWHGLRDSHI